MLRSNEVESKFVFHLLKTSKFKLISNISTGTKMPRSDWNIVSNSTFSVPRDYYEGEKISTLVSSLEKSITLHQRSFTRVQKILQEYQTKMFPSSERLIPDIRYKNHTDYWRKMELGDVGNTFTGLSGKTKDDFGHGNAEYVTYLNVFKNPVSDLSSTDKIEIDVKQNSLEYGDVLFTTSSETPNEVGMSSVWLDNRPNVYLNSFCFGFRPTMTFDYSFLASMLRSDSFRRQMFILAQGVSRYNISKVKAMNIKIQLPDYEEQVNIGKFFKLLNLRLALQKRKVQKLQELKELYLYKMFL